MRSVKINSTRPGKKKAMNTIQLRKFDWHSVLQVIDEINLMIQQIFPVRCFGGEISQRWVLKVVWTKLCRIWRIHGTII